MILQVLIQMIDYTISNQKKFKNLTSEMEISNCSTIQKYYFVHVMFLNLKQLLLVAVVIEVSKQSLI